MAVQLIRYRFTVADYHRMVEAGILTEENRVELLDGEIVEMAPIGSRHAACVNRLTQLLAEQVGRRAIVSIQNPIPLGEHSEPQTDLALLKPRPDFYAQSHPGPEDVLLVAEVTEASAEYDRKVKVPLYSKFGVPEVWLVDLQGKKIEVYRHPSSEGYRELSAVQPGESLAPLALPDLVLSAEAVLD